MGIFITASGALRILSTAKTTAQAGDTANCPSVLLKPSRGNAVSFHSNIMESSTTAVYHRKNFLELPGVLPSMNLTDQLMARDGVTVQVQHALNAEARYQWNTVKATWKERLVLLGLNTPLQ